VCARLCLAAAGKRAHTRLVMLLKRPLGAKTKSVQSRSRTLEIARTAAYLFCMRRVSECERDDFVNARIINLGEERQTDQTASGVSE
jgi:hypothetical protein